MKRLIRKTVKTASNNSIDLDCFVLSSGSRIAISTRLVNNKPWYQVYKEDAFSSSSFYDGDNYERALRYYKDLMTAFNGVQETESFDLYSPKIKQQVDNMIKDKQSNSYNDMLVKRDNLFLGVNDFGF